MRAFWQATALPSGVRGPVERIAFWRFAVSRAGVAIVPQYITATITGSRLDGSSTGQPRRPPREALARRETRRAARSIQRVREFERPGSVDSVETEPMTRVLPAPLVGLEWPELRRLFDERERRRRLAEAWAGRD